MHRKAIEAAHKCAQTMLDKFEVKSPADIQLDLFADYLCARVVQGELDGAEAQLVRSGGSATITLADRIKDVVAIRFNLAHELGHLAMAHPTPAAAELACNPQKWSRAQSVESEASAWGAEVLMPERLVGPRCEVSNVDLEVPQQIARDYTVSILASAIRFTQLTNARCAAVFSVDGKVKWSARSARFRKRIKRGKPLERLSVAFDYFSRGELDDAPQGVPADAWIDTKGAEAEIVEHSICSPRHGSVLSMLWIPDAVASALRIRG
jgi:hypothetical protein